MSDSMAREFALSITGSIKAYISQHRTEYAAWEAEQTEAEHE